MSQLPQAPHSLVDERGAPRFGAYAGSLLDTSVSPLAGRWRRTGIARIVAEKKWLYACVSSPSIVFTAAILRFGYGGGAFFYAFDRRERRLVIDRSLRAPAGMVELDDNPAEARATFRGLRSKLLIEASRLGGRIQVSVPELSADIQLRPEGAPEPLTAICPVPGDRVTMTQKSSCIAVSGELRIGASAWPLREDAFASLDYTHGLLARETRWRWANACGRLEDGRLLGLNLVEGHNDGPVSENGVWIGDRVLPLGRAHFHFDEAAPLGEWAIETEDGSASLRFQPEGSRSEHFDLGLIASDYVQPIGVFAGTVRGPGGEALELRGLPGVTESHRSVW